MIQKPFRERCESVKISRSTMTQCRKWAKRTGRQINSILDIAILFAIRHQGEVEREVAMKLEVKP